MDSTDQQALARWQQVTVQTVRAKGPDLSSRQWAVLLTVYLNPPPHTVRALAADLAVSKPAITRAIDALEKLEFVRRLPDERDRRSVLVQRTVKGSVFLDGFADLLRRAT